MKHKLISPGGSAGCNAVLLSLVTAGAFCCDVVLDPQLDSWTPSEVSTL